MLLGEDWIRTFGMFMWFIEKPHFSLNEVFEHFFKKSGKNIEKMGYQKGCKKG